MTTDSSREALAAQSPVGALRGVGPVRERVLREAGIETVLDLILRVPKSYEDRRTVTQVGDVVTEGSYTLVGVLEKVNTVRLYRRRMTLVRATLRSATGSLAVTWFNRPYLAGSISQSEEYLLHGRVRRRGETLELLNPSLEAKNRAGLGAAIVPIYPAIASLGPTLVRQIVQNALQAGVLSDIDEPLPENLLREHGLPALGEALAELHRPSQDGTVEALNAGSTPAHGRLIYGELLGLQTELALARRRIRGREKKHRYRNLAGVRERLVVGLPFRLTGSQNAVLDEILEDLESPSPMMRLLQGDVGCGKTVVAGVAMAAAAESGLQATLMAPTELLAEQHYRSLRELLGDRYGLRLLTSATATPQVREDLRTGRARLSVGTHALMQQAVEFDRLALAVIDEQHRFGVTQRRELLAKGERPDLLVMTATPIPRSLAMTLYGDLSASIIDELPPGRQPVVTRVESARKRESVYRWLEGELDGGNKAFVVLPLIEESERVEAEAVEGLGRRIAERLGSYRPTLLHGRMDSATKSELMNTFAKGESQVLIATTLIEVGVDVPEATVMVIESAERFGLAQLHQLRGRVGRGARPSTCIAMYGRLSQDARRRLEVFRSTLDGFELAEADLELRGPGDLLGTRQAGIPGLGLSDLVKHRHWIEKARRDARDLVRDRPFEGESFLAALESRVGVQAHLAGG
ncbi:MAG: ATP-dependent DNA helicase RecG [Acidobacteria bacterium]|nr:ATP-dependent DNA helicase RecG [Acidobacteriota bacterium]